MGDVGVGKRGAPVECGVGLSGEGNVRVSVWRESCSS